MDHSHHMHAMEGHEGHGGHGGGMQDMCSMNMLFTWDTTNLCIVFRQWHVRSTASLIFSLIAVVLLGIGYEALRSVSRRYEASLATRLETVPSESIYLLSLSSYISSALLRISPLVSTRDKSNTCLLQARRESPQISFPPPPLILKE